MAGEHLLLVDDDRPLCQQLKKQLVREGYAVTVAETAADALRLVAESAPALVILDISLAPDRDGTPCDGIDVLRRIRRDYETPVFMLSATAVGAVKVMALTMGADDYMTKPFDVQEFLARVQVILRRMARTSPSAVEKRFGDLRIDPESRQIWRGDAEILLTAIEFELLWTLASRPNRVFSREQLIELAWKHTYYGVPKVVDVHIGHIRKKLEQDPTNPVYIKTIRGVGYRFATD